MALHSITPTISPTNVAYDQMQRNTASDNVSWYTLKQQEEQAKRQRKQDKIDNINNILKMAGSAIDLYTKYQSINTKKLEEKNAELEYGLKTVQLQNALTKTSMAAQDTKDKAEIGDNISTFINQEDSEGLYKYLMSNISKLSKNPSMVQSAVSYLGTHGYSEDDLEFISNTGLTANQVRQSIDKRLKTEAANKRAEAKNLTPEMKANQEATLKMERSVLNLGNSVASDPKLVSAFSSIVPEIGSPDGIDSLKRKILTGEITCKSFPNWQEEFGQALNTPDYSGPFSGYEGLLSQYSTSSSNMNDVNQYPPTEDNLEEEPLMSVRVPDKNVLDNIYLCRNNTTNEVALVPMNKKDSEDFNNILGEGARRLKGESDIRQALGMNTPTQTTSEGVVSTSSTPPSTSSTSPSTKDSAKPNILQESELKARELYKENPTGAIQQMVSDIRNKIPVEARRAAIKAWIGTDSFTNENEILYAYYDAKFSGKPISEATKAAKAIAQGKSVEESTPSENTPKVSTENKPSKYKGNSRLLELKEQFNTADPKEKDLIEREYTRVFAGKYLDTNADSAMTTDMRHLLTKAGVNPMTFDDVKNNKDIISMIVKKRLQGVSEEEIQRLVKQVTPEDSWQKERPVKVTNTESGIKRKAQDYQKTDDKGKKKIKESLRKTVEGNVLTYGPEYATPTLKKYLSKAKISQSLIGEVTNLEEVIDVIVDGLANNVADANIAAKVKETIKLK